MAEQPIKHNELIEDNVFQPTSDSADILLEKLSLLIGGFKELAKITGAKINAGIDPKTIGDVDKLTQAKEKLANIEKGLTEVEKIQIQTKEKIRQARIQEIDQLKAQDGILGNLIVKRKELQKSLLSASTTNEVKKINQELFKTNLEIKNVKEGGVKAFNSWGNALESFQFKFNTLGNLIGGFAAGLASGGLSLLTSALSNLGGVVLEFITKSEQRKKVTEEINKLEEKQIENQKELSDTLKDINKEIDKQNNRRDVATGLISEEAKNEIELREIQFEAIEKANEDFQKAQEERLKLTKNNNEKYTRIRIDGEEKIVTKSEKLGEDLLLIEKTKLDAITNANAEFNKGIATLQAERAEKDKQDEDELFDKKIENAKKDLDAQIKADEDSAKEREKSLKKEFNAFVKYWDSVDKLEQDRLRKGEKEWEDFIKEIEDINQKGKEQRWKSNDKDEEENQKSLDKQFKAFTNYWDKQDALEKKRLNEKEKANQEALKRGTEALFDGLEQRNEREKELNADKISELDKQINFQQQLALNGEVNTLDALERERAKALEEKAAIEKRAAKQKEAEQLAEIFLEFMKAYAGDKNNFAPAAKALAQTLIAKGISKAIAGSFAEGVENFKGKGTGTSDSNLIAFSNKESVVTAKGTAETKGLVTAVNDRGFLGAQDWAMQNIFPKVPMLQDKSRNEQVAGAILSLLDNRLQSLEKTIKNKTEWTISENLFGEIVKARKQNGINNITTVKISRINLNK
jgi:hypothetical protein